MSVKYVQVRVEEDLLGKRSIPSDCYYGIHTERALENFPISHYKSSDFPELIQALVSIKAAAAYANGKLGLLTKGKCRAIERACKRILKNEMWEHFPLDMLQGGGGTSFNMNVNEVIANLAGELLGDRRGSYKRIRPLEEVNRSQSTNDVYPSAIRVAVFNQSKELIGPLKSLARSLGSKEKEFASVAKLGRTCLQDAVPMTLGQEFSGYKGLVARVASDLDREILSLQELNIGGTAVGTGISCHRSFARLVLEYLNKSATKGRFVKAKNLFDATQNCDVLLAVSGKLKNIGLALSKIANDLRLLSSGPEAGLSEITVPAVQAGSSIMPGKVNPVLPEVINQVAYRVCGNDVTISMALERGELELNIMEPVMALCLLESIEILTNGVRVFDKKCIKGIKANRDTCLKYAGSRTGIYTLLSEELGHNKVSELISESQAKGMDVKSLILEKKLLTKSELRKCLKIK